ncbi:MAG: hypothetical protein ACR2NN_17780 [Bryobacteraceae bacterium]
MDKIVAGFVRESRAVRRGYGHWTAIASGLAGIALLPGAADRGGGSDFHFAIVGDRTSGAQRGVWCAKSQNRGHDCFKDFADEWFYQRVQGASERIADRGPGEGD